MRKRGRPERALDRRNMVVVLAALWQHNALASIFSNRIHGCSSRAWLNRGTMAEARIKSILQKRGGAVNWDEPYYSETSDGEEATFLPREEEEQFESENDDDEEGQSDVDLLDSPFLNSFQREIHSIVSDYRQEVSDTFQHLMEDVLDARDRQTRSPRRSERYSTSDEDRQEERIYSQKSLPTRRHVIEEDSDDDDDDNNNNNNNDFVVGDTDEDENEVVFRVRDARDTDEEDSWENIVWDEDEEPDYSNRRAGSDDGFSGYAGRFAEERGGKNDTEKTLESKSTPERPHKKKRRKRRKLRNVEHSERREVDAEVDAEPSVASVLGSAHTRAPADHAPADHAPADHAPADQAPVEQVPVDQAVHREGNTALSHNGAKDVANMQMWKSVTVVVSFLAVALLLNIAIQILSKMLWKKAA